MIRCCRHRSRGRCVIVWQEAGETRANKLSCTFSPCWFVVSESPGFYPYSSFLSIELFVRGQWLFSKSANTRYVQNVFRAHNYLLTEHQASCKHTDSSLSWKKLCFSCFSVLASTTGHVLSNTSRSVPLLFEQSL